MCIWNLFELPYTQTIILSRMIPLRVHSFDAVSEQQQEKTLNSLRASKTFDWYYIYTYRCRWPPGSREPVYKSSLPVNPSRGSARKQLTEDHYAAVSRKGATG